MKREQFQTLLDKYLAGTASAIETEQLMQAIADDQHKQLVIECIGDRWDSWNVQQLLSADQSEQMYRSIAEAIQPIAQGQVKMLPVIWKRVAVAAAVIGIAVVTTLYLLPSRVKQQVAKVSAAAQAVPDIDAPAAAHAVITLANGKKIVIDSASVGKLANQDDVVLEKLADGELVYAGQTDKPGMNTLYNPRGSKVVNVRLSDGSRVWLNSESSLTYPTSFAGRERKVQMTGEVYFEIAHDKSKPFLVGFSNTEVEVLGTHFNINAYDDENSMRTTLLEGRIRLTSAKQSLVMEPGQQAVQQLNTAAIQIGNADVNQVMAWRNGFFEFDNVDLQTIMRQIARWYDVEVVYENMDNSIRLGGGISRNLNLQYLLRLLKMNGVNSKLEGRRLFVSVG